MPAYRFLVMAEWATHGFNKPHRSTRTPVPIVLRIRALMLALYRAVSSLIEVESVHWG